MPQPTSGEFLEFDLSSEIEQLKQEEAWQSGRNSKTILKQPDMRVVLVAMKAGNHIARHQADGRISVQPLRGHIRMTIPGNVFELPVGRLLFLDRAVPHDVHAVEESAFLLTIAWPERTEQTSKPSGIKYGC